MQRIRILTILKEEHDAIGRILNAAMAERRYIKLEQVMNVASVLAAELPRRIREAFAKLKKSESKPILVVRGLKVDSCEIGPTPSRHKPRGRVEKVNRYEALHVLFASLLGDPFGWTTIQNGYVINDVMPVWHHRGQLSSSGSSLNFDLHTEDAFTPLAGDFLGFFCLRNPNRVPTIFSCLPTESLGSTTQRVLRENRFIIGANIAQNVPQITHASPILFGPQKHPYLRINLNATKAQPDDRRAKLALDALIALLSANRFEFVLNAGDYCYIDNFRTLHGRNAFMPKFDGSDRWLKRLYISCSWRQLVAYSLSNKRVIDPLLFDKTYVSY